MLAKNFSEGQYVPTNGTNVRTISWTAVIIGAIVGVGLSFLINLFNVGIGLSAFTTDENGIITLAIGGFVGVIITAIVSMYIVGWVAGWLARYSNPRPMFGAFHGFIAWCLSLIFVLFLAAHVSVLMGSSTALLSDTSINRSIAKINNQDTSTAPIEELMQPANAQQARNIEKAANALGILTLGNFFIFLLGALASCLGGYYGIQSRIENKLQDEPLQNA